MHAFLAQNKFHHPTRSRPRVEFLHPGRIALCKKFFLKVAIIVMNFMLEYLHFKFVNKFCWASKLYNALCEVGVTCLLHHCILDDSRHQGRLILAAYAAFHHCGLAMSEISSWPLDSGSVKRYHPQRLHGWPASQNGKLGPERELLKNRKIYISTITITCAVLQGGKTHDTLSLQVNSDDSDKGILRYTSFSTSHFSACKIPWQK